MTRRSTRLDARRPASRRSGALARLQPPRSTSSSPICRPRGHDDASAARSLAHALAAPEEVGLPPRTRHRRARIRPIPSLQGPSRPPWGDAFAVSGHDGPDGDRLAAAACARARARALRARGGGGARAARGGGRRGRPLGRRRPGEARRGGRRSSSRIGGGVAAGGCRARREEPRRAGRVAARRGGARARHPDLERGRARLPAARRQPARRRHRARTARRRRPSCSARSSAPPGGRSRSPGNVGRALTDVAEQIEPGRVGRLRALELPARGRAHARLRRRRPAQPRAGPPRPPRHLRGVPRREAPDLRARAREDRAARLRARRHRVRRRRPAARRAAASPARTTARTPPPRRPPRARPASATTRSPRRCARSRACRTGSSSCASCDGVRYVNDSKATNTAAARRGVAAYDAPLRLILGGSLKGEDFAAVRARAAGERPLDLSDRRGGRRARAGARRGRPRVLARRRSRARASRTPRPTREPGDVVLLSPAARELRPVRELRGARRRVPPARRGARVSTRARARTRSSGSCSCSSRSRSRRSGSSWSTARRRRRRRSGTATRSATSSGRAIYALARPRAAGRRRAHATSASCALLAPTLVVDRARRSALAVLVVGERINGARRWIGFGPAAFQPSELAKLALVVWCAAYLARKPPPRTLEGARDARSACSSASSALLILVEPDLGTVITIVVMVGAMLLVSGTPLPTLATRVRDRRRRSPRSLPGSIAVPARAPPRLPRPVAGPAGRRLPERAGADQPRLGRRLRARARAGDRRRSTTSPRRTRT